MANFRLWQSLNFPTEEAWLLLMTFCLDHYQEHVEPSPWKSVIIILNLENDSFFSLLHQEVCECHSYHDKWSSIGNETNKIQEMKT